MRPSKGYNPNYYGPPGVPNDSMGDTWDEILGKWGVRGLIAGGVVGPLLASGAPGGGAGGGAAASGGITPGIVANSAPSIGGLVAPTATGAVATGGAGAAGAPWYSQVAKAAGSPIGKLAIGGGIAALGAKAASGGGADGSGINPYTAILSQHSQDANARGDELSGQGSGATSDVLKYYRDLMSPNGSAVMEATAPERGRVLDQYDTARRAIAQFGPRGGGTTSAAAQSRYDQAESMGDITSNARRSAAAGASELGLQLQSLGLTSEMLASQDLDTIIRSILNRDSLDVMKRGQTMGMWGGIGQAAGQLAGLYLTRPGGIWGEKTA